MIHESFYWKKELYDNFQVIARFRSLQKRYEQSYVKIEKAILMGAYIIRKLDEAQKIPPEFLKISEVDITSASIQREIKGKDNQGKDIYGEMKQQNADYTYPMYIDIPTEIEKTMRGEIYKRIEFE